MKKVLITTTALVMTAGVAAAEVSVGGDGRMGFESNAGTNGDLQFESRIRISFSASGETDAGLSFGGSIRADNSGGGAAGTDGSVFVEGTFGKISMGDVAGAPEAAVGDLSGVGMTGAGDFNEFVYLSNNPGLTTIIDTAGAGTGENARQAARWDYTTGDLGIHVSSDQISGEVDAYGIAVTYSAGDFSFGLGHEDISDAAYSADHTIGQVTGSFGDATVKAIYGSADLNGADFEQMGLSVDYVSGATTLTAYYRTVEVDALDGDVFGVGVAYDLGGGASLKAGWADGDDVNPVSATFGDALADPSYDFGITMSF
ncbi:MAG: porin [Paracoccaceae bacterium]